MAVCSKSNKKLESIWIPVFCCLVTSHQSLILPCIRTILDREENKDDERTGEGGQTGQLRALETEGQTAVVAAEEFQKETKQ